MSLSLALPLPSRGWEENILPLRWCLHKQFKVCWWVVWMQWPRLVSTLLRTTNAWDNPSALSSLLRVSYFGARYFICDQTLWQMPQHIKVIAVGLLEGLFDHLNQGFLFIVDHSVLSNDCHRNVSSPFRNYGGKRLRTPGRASASDPCAWEIDIFFLSLSPPSLLLSSFGESWLSLQAANRGANLTYAQLISGCLHCQNRLLVCGAQAEALKSTDKTEITSSCPSAHLVNNPRCHLMISRTLVS